MIKQFQFHACISSYLILMEFGLGQKWLLRSLSGFGWILCSCANVYREISIALFKFGMDNRMIISQIQTKFQSTPITICSLGNNGNDFLNSAWMFYEDYDQAINMEFWIILNVKVIISYLHAKPQINCFYFCRKNNFFRKY